MVRGSHGALDGIKLSARGLVADDSRNLLWKRRKGTAMDNQKISINLDQGDLIRDISGIDDVKHQEEAKRLAGIKKAAYESVVKWPAAGLKKKAKPVEFEIDISNPLTEEIKTQIQKMKDTMITLNGVGIAANQMGYDNAICICWFGAREPSDIVVMINPKIVAKTGAWVVGKEACLSCGGCYGTIPRRDSIEMEWEDPEGFVQHGLFLDWDARIVQHEMDHLDGIVIVDKFNAMDKLACRYEIEALQLNAAIMPKRLANKGMVFKNV